jgi:hypothetical protein
MAQPMNRIVFAISIRHPRNVLGELQVLTHDPKVLAFDHESLPDLLPKEACWQ